MMSGEATWGECALTPSTCAMSFTNRSVDSLFRVCMALSSVQSQPPANSSVSKPS